MPNDKVLHDSQVAGGEWRRGIDEALSKNLGGYKSLPEGSSGELSIYGKYVEPILHATEHTARIGFILILVYQPFHPV